MARDSASSISPEELLKAYSLGYFPMAKSKDEKDVVWVLPEIRGALPLDQARCPRRLKRFLVKNPFTMRVNSAFSSVIAECAAETKDREDTWINDEIKEVYCELHHLGIAHSIECYEGEELVGGLYGVAVGGVFCGESMFSRRTNASKIALLQLITRLKHTGYKLLDTQFYTPHLAQFGVSEIDNEDYQLLLNKYLPLDARFSDAPHSFSADVVLQSITQTS